ncbi:hypothetical protein EHM69_06480 [candidate division KSB1 bacterium]|nr:MAG: hypothetical protein EHM69_06480 [candidate division KSB1 bacterium]
MRFLTISNRAAIGITIGIVATIFFGCSNIGNSSRSARPAGLTSADSSLDRLGRAMGVCPPFKLRDENGAIIDPKHGENASVPYSPKQTCGASGCHNYDRISQGFHFQQGKDEKPSAEYAARYNWVSHPGNYGGNWCSPAPLYRQLAPKKNRSAREIDMTSYEFITATCGNCHAGGGPLEYDRDGHRYDEWMRLKGYTPGGENELDGDYYKARWSQTGVIETDCNLCHVPEYNYKGRNAQLAKLNFKWAATVGADFATVSGSIAQDETPTVAYDLKRFDDDGNIIMHIVPEPRNETCLRCHFKPGWKKRGASFSERTDVHVAAGLRCVDCHAAGSKATDPRIQGWEVHQFGKGDDPSGFVRNDLDNTVRSCEDCHLKGWRNSPVAKHDWLPPLHMEKLSCQACHIPSRAVKSALVQASDIYNPAPRISPPGKHIWAFYDQDMKFWNHYGELELFTGSDQPTDVSNPTLIRYKGKIYPANRVHSAWVGFEEKGKPGLNQLFMKDFFMMWSEHRKDPQNNYPQLRTINDDNGDGLIEVNRPEEIDALLSSTRAYLDRTKFPMDERRLVWVSDDRVYYSSHENRAVPRESYEATAYASVYKFSHDVAPARAALGAHSCTDCHSSGAAFFQSRALAVPFSGNDAQPKWIANHDIMGITSGALKLGAFRESVVKPAALWIVGTLALLLLLHYVVYGPRTIKRYLHNDPLVQRFSLFERLAHFFVLAGFLILIVTAFLFFENHRSLNGEAVRNLHTWVGLAFGAGLLGLIILWFQNMLFTKGDAKWLRALGGYFGWHRTLPAGKFNAGQKLFFWMFSVFGLALIVTGAAMAVLRISPQTNLALLYTVHDIAGVFFMVLIITHFYLGVILNPHSLRSIFGGKVSRQWVDEHHPDALRQQE